MNIIISRLTQRNMLKASHSYHCDREQERGIETKDRMEEIDAAKQNKNAILVNE